MNTEFNYQEFNKWYKKYQKIPYEELLTLKKQMEKDGSCKDNDEKYTALIEEISMKHEILYC